MLYVKVLYPEDVEQVCRYAADAKELLPDFHIRQFVIYVVANKGYKIWEVYESDCRKVRQMYVITHLPPSAAPFSAISIRKVQRQTIP